MIDDDDGAVITPVSDDIDADSEQDDDTALVERDITPLGSNASRTREWFGAHRVALCIAGALVLSVAAIGTTIEIKHSHRASTIARTIDGLRADIDSAQADEADSQAIYDRAASRLERSERKSGGLLATARKQRAEHAALQKQVSALQKQVDALVMVPDVGGMDQSEAETALSDAGLQSRVELIDGTCADYQGHFVDRDFGWNDIVRQETRPGTRVIPQATVTLVLFDYGSNWEMDCITGADY